MNKAKMILCVFISLIAIQINVSAKVEIILGNVPVDKNPNLINFFPKTDASEIIISRDQYVLSYNKLNRSPNWVAWVLDTSKLGNSGRTNSFIQDMDLENYLDKFDDQYKVVMATDYRGSCFDRGHQLPSADRTVSAEDNRTTFLMTNMAPQTPFLNRVIWEQLESYTRTYVKSQNKKAFIIAGPIFDENFGAIGPNKDIKVPAKEFKLIFFVNADQTPLDINRDTPSIAVIMPNVLKDGSKPDYSNGCKNFNELNLPTNSGQEWEKYRTTITDIENSAHIQLLK
jgi:endonuclease G